MRDPLQKESLSKKSEEPLNDGDSTCDCSAAGEINEVKKSASFAAAAGSGSLKKVSSLSLCKTTTREIEWRPGLQGAVQEFDTAVEDGEAVAFATSSESSSSVPGKVSGSMDKSFRTLRSKRYS